MRRAMTRLHGLGERLIGARAWTLVGTVFRFGVSGGLGAAVYMATFYSLTEWAGVFYLHSSLAAWLIAFCVSFLMQQRWTFRGEGPRARRQLALYGGLFLFNMGLNEVLLYLLVDRAHVPRQIAQLGLLMMISTWNFFIMRHFIFCASQQVAEPPPPGSG